MPLPSGDLLLRAVEWGAVRRLDGSARRDTARKINVPRERAAAEAGGAGAEATGGAGAAVRRAHGVRRIGAPQRAGPSWGRLSRRETLTLLVVAGTAAMMLPHAVSSPSPGESAAASRCPRASAISSPYERGQPLECSAPLLSTRVVLSAPTCTTGLGPAAAGAKVSSLRLRGGDEGGDAAVDSAPNAKKSPSYKEAAAKGVPLNGDGEKAVGADARKDGRGANGEKGEDELVLQVDELKLEALRKLGQSLRLGGRGTARRKFKSVRKGTSKMDDVKSQNALRKAGLNPVSEIENIEMYKEDGTVLSFKSPKLLSNGQANTFCIHGSYTERKAPKPTEAQLAAKAFDQLSDIEKLRQLAAAELDVSKGAGGEKTDSAQVTTPEDVLAAEEDDAGDAGEGEEAAIRDRGSPEDMLAADGEDDAAAGGSGGEEVDGYGEGEAAVEGGGE